MEIKVNDYVRTDRGNISKIKFITHVVFFKNEIKSATICLENGETIRMYYGDIIKSSPRIIDLIEVGDYVNGEYVTYINKKDNYVDVGYDDAILRAKDIKSVLTKEMFEQMEYKLEKE